MKKVLINVRVPADFPPPRAAAWLGRMVGEGYSRVAERFDRHGETPTPAARLRARAARVAAKYPGLAGDLRAVADRSEWPKQA
jgi:hypothetical protein